MNKQDFISEALMGKLSPGESKKPARELSNLRESIKTLSKAALVGLLMAGCAGSDNVETSSESQTTSQEKQELAKSRSL